MENQKFTPPLSPEKYATYFEMGVSYDEYFANMKAEVENKIESPYAKYVPMNFQRVKRIGKTFKLQEGVANVLQNLDVKINWLVISESWCGDASQTVPIMQGIAAASEGKITLKVIYRDQNPELIDAHLTNGGKSIPKLVQLDENFQFIADWGPRPKEAQAYILAAKADNIPYAIFSENLHKWYADNKTVATQLELSELLKIKELA